MNEPESDALDLRAGYIRDTARRVDVKIIRSDAFSVVATLP